MVIGAISDLSDMTHNRDVEYSVAQQARSQRAQTYFRGPCIHYPMDSPNNVCIECLSDQVQRTHELLEQLLPMTSDGNNEG